MAGRRCNYCGVHNEIGVRSCESCGGALYVSPDEREAINDIHTIYAGDREHANDPTEPDRDGKTAVEAELLRRVSG